ncbi:MAG: 30S ribosomal protein S9 [Nitrososphaerota archaeon]
MVGKTQKFEVDNLAGQNISEFIYSVGRRKTSTARVRLYQGAGEIIVNDMPIGKYFPGELCKYKYQLPLVVTDTLGKVWATVKVKGSGKSAQLDAVVHGLSRALVKLNKDFRDPLRKAGLLTRDPRVKERRKYGLAQKARKGKQSPKR